MSSVGSMISKEERIFVAGHRGMVGAAIYRLLTAKGYKNVVTQSRHELDLLDQRAVADFFKSSKLDRVILAAAKVGGIHANNSYPAEFIYNNLTIQNNVIHQAYNAGVKDLLFLGSSCIYPKLANQPMSEESLLTDTLEPTNEPYAVAKIAGIKMCEAYNRQYGVCYRSIMPTNLFGPGDNYHLENSHVIPAMIRKFHLGKLATDGHLGEIIDDERKYGPIPADVQKAIGYCSETKTIENETNPQVILWGTGKPRREFLHVEDMAEACLFVMGLAQNEFEKLNTSFLNVGTGVDITIKEVANILCEIIGFEGKIVFDSTMPDGTPQKLLNTSKINSLGWSPKLTFRNALVNAYDSYRF